MKIPGACAAQPNGLPFADQTHVAGKNESGQDIVLPVSLLSVRTYSHKYMGCVHSELQIFSASSDHSVSCPHLDHGDLSRTGADCVPQFTIIGCGYRTHRLILESSAYIFDSLKRHGLMDMRRSVEYSNHPIYRRPNKFLLILHSLVIGFLRVYAFSGRNKNLLFFLVPWYLVSVPRTT